MQTLIVGGSAVSGQMILAAVREKHAKAHIAATTSSPDRAVTGADLTIPGIDLAQPDAVDKILGALRGVRPEIIAYIPARGEVGLPTARATREMVRQSIDYCIRPMLRLTQALRPKMTICLSGFITMEPMLECYGAMAYSKLVMEDLVVRHPGQLKAIRLGMFPSNSVRGIMILTQRNLMRTKYPELAQMAAAWRSSGRKFSDFFDENNWHYEETVYRSTGSWEKPFRPTEADDIRLAMRRILDGEPAPILNVLGDWVWTESAMPKLPEVVRAHPDFLEWDLDQYLSA